jgi:hypothetical protein
MSEKWEPTEDEAPALVRSVIVKSVLDVPANFFDNWHWIVAVDAFDYGDPQPLAHLLTQYDVYPENVRAVLTDIVQGTRKPSPKRIAHAKIKGKDRMEVALSALASSVVHDCIQRNASHHGDHSRREPIDVVEENTESYRKERDLLCNSYSISKETVDNLRRELKSKIEKWPLL